MPYYVILGDLVPHLLWFVVGDSHCQSFTWSKALTEKNVYRLAGTVSFFSKKSFHRQDVWQRFAYLLSNSKQCTVYTVTCSGFPWWGVAQGKTVCQSPDDSGTTSRSSSGVTVTWVVGSSCRRVTSWIWPVMMKRGTVKGATSKHHERCYLCPE